MLLNFSLNTKLLGDAERFAESKGKLWGREAVGTTICLWLIFDLPLKSTLQETLKTPPDFKIK
jgi:hypothetical protein